MKKEIYMEDVSSIALEALELVKNRLKEFGIEINDGQDDEIYVPLFEKIEKISGCPDYRRNH